jgi:pimeloyl-ACP methyl ester carboxylesterase
MKAVKSLVLFILLALLFGACSSSRPDLSPEAGELPEDAQLVTLDADCDGTLIAPKLASSQPGAPQIGDGSLYELYYNESAYKGSLFRRLVIFAHGYFDPYHPEEPVLPNDYHPDHNAVVCNLIDQGFAVAWSSYAHNGSAVESGYKSSKELRQIVMNHFSQKHKWWDPWLSNRVYAIGHSQGGIIVTMLAEEAGSGFHGALALCGPLGGWPVQVQYLGHHRAAFDAYFQNNYQDSYTELIPTTNPLQPANHVPDDPSLIPWSGHHNGGFVGETLDEKIAAVVSKNPALTQEMAAIAQLKLPYANDDELVRSIVDPLYFSVRGANQALDVAGGSPFNNQHTVYAPSSKEVIRYRRTSISGGNPLEYVKSYYDTTGKLQTRLITLHTTRDPVVPYAHQPYYRDKAVATGSTSSLTQRFVRRYGHCNFSDQELINQINALVLWAEWNSKPSDGDATVLAAGEPVLPHPSEDPQPVLDPGPPFNTYEVSASVSGGGTVTSNPAGIDCPGNCTADLPDTNFPGDTLVTFTASADVGQTFSGWGGDCTFAGSNASCTLTLNADLVITAAFEEATVPPGPERTLTLRMRGNGSGTVTFTPGDIVCTSNCTAAVADGTTVTLAAEPASGSTFDSWSGCDSSASSTCTVTMNGDKTVTTWFRRARR